MTPQFRVIPRNVRRFASLWVISFLMELPCIFFLPTSDAVKLGVSPDAEMKLLAAVLVFLFVVLVPFLYLAVWKRKNWARWLLFVIFLICLPFLFASPMFQPDYLVGTALTFASAVVEALGFYFAFRGDAQPWFARHSK